MRLVKTQNVPKLKERILTWSMDTEGGRYCGFTWVTCRFSLALLCGINAPCLRWDLRISDCGIRLNCHPPVALVLKEALVQRRCLQSVEDCLQSPCDSAQICTSKCDFKWDTIYSVASFPCPGSKRILASEYPSCVCIHLTCCYCNRCYPQIKCGVRNMIFGWRIDISYLR